MTAPIILDIINSRIIGIVAESLSILNEGGKQCMILEVLLWNEK